MKKFLSSFTFAIIVVCALIAFIAFNSPVQTKKMIECHSLVLKDSLQVYFSKGYALKQHFITSTQFKDLYDGTHFPNGKGMATSQYLLIFEKQ